MFKLDKILHLKSALEYKVSQVNKQNEISILIHIRGFQKASKIPK